MRIHAENSAEIFSSTMDLLCNRPFKLKIANFDIIFRHEYIPAQENTLRGEVFVFSLLKLRCATRRINTALFLCAIVSSLIKFFRES